MHTEIRPDAVLVQAVIAGALSFAHLHDLAAAAGQDGWKAWAYPISVDLLLVAAWRRLRLLRGAGEPTRSAWTWFAVALAASLGANVATAGLLDLDAVPSWLRILVAGWPALAFLGGTLLVHKATEGPAVTPEHDQNGHAHVAPLQASEPEQTVPEVQAPEPAPALPPSASAVVPVPDALLAYGRKVADEHQARTGNPIDPDTLRARLGVPAPMAQAIAAQLA
ncbi:DUF2637 domain-containing protein [Streptomyces antimicrobicus]|uniref:DUF2637 domain-containing protein n=1 Tax=Streptomyces antimicrobicus TaxID=2883108 RepID=A0ABS8B6P8_9ACTN|nr:DUF2637 domain-containing protein [Streptomyces antimicrobicus]MCB5180262.1 DUF2637 domain-containing protein [Streptomyces antimicrobicus]